jgi:hypothetical protein
MVVGFIREGKKFKCKYSQKAVNWISLALTKTRRKPRRRREGKRIQYIYRYI